jgi:DNA-binding NarL/FixJ family response regulator
MQAVEKIARQASTDLPTVRALIVSEVRFLRECLADIIHDMPGWTVHDQCATLSHAVASVIETRPHVVLLDGSFPSGKEATARLADANREGSVVVFAVTENEESVLSWAEAGAKGYVPNTASIDDLGVMISQIMFGEQSCPPRIAGSLFRRIASAGKGVWPPVTPPSPLTGREIEILGLIGAGLSNKEIARRLGVSLGTAKSHVHNLLRKLRLHRRSDVMLYCNAALQTGGANRPASHPTPPSMDIDPFIR